MKNTIIKSGKFDISIRVSENSGFLKTGEYTVLNRDLTGLDFWHIYNAIARTHGRRKIEKIEIFDSHGNFAGNDNFINSEGSFFLHLNK